MRVSFLLPTLNEEEGLATALRDIPVKALRDGGHDVEVVIVDGMSTDGTLRVALDAGARVIEEPRRGYGRAYKTGMPECKGDVIVTGDADGTYPFEIVPSLLERMAAAKLDFVTVDRYADLQKGSMSAKHRLGNWVLSVTTRILFGVPLRDSQSGMWLIRRKALRRLPIERLPDGMAFSQEVKIEALKRVAAAEFPGSLRARVGEVKLDSWRDGLGNLWALLRKRLTTRWPKRSA